MSDIAPTLEPFVRQWAVLLTTYKRDGTPIGTPVNLAVEGDRAYFRTYHKAWKTKRLKNNPCVLLAPSSFRGKPTGASVRGRARLLEGEDEANARKAIAKAYPVVQRFLIPFGHKVSRYTTMHYEVVLDPVPSQSAPT